MEATILGIPAVAISYTGRDPVAIERFQTLLEKLIPQLIQRGDFPPETLLNVNLPPIEPEEVRGVRVTRLARRVYTDSLTRATDPSGREYFWIGGGGVEWVGDQTSDFRAIEEGYVSVTPLHLDLTNYKLLSEVEKWGLGT
jgi:5'-nucleotidase